MDGAQLSRVLCRLYDAAYAEGDWTQALDGIGTSVQAKGIMLYAYDLTGELTFDRNYANSFYSDKVEQLQEYNRHFLEGRNSSWDLDATMALAQFEPFGPVLDYDIWGEEEFAQSAEIRWAKERAGIFRRRFFNLSKSREVMSGLILQYDAAFADPPSGDCAGIAPFVPHVSKAVRMNRFFSPLKQKYDAILGVLDRLQVAVCLLNGAGRMVLSNSVAQQLFDEKDAIRLTPQGLLACADDDCNRKLSHALQKIGQTASGQDLSIEATVPITRVGSEDPLLAIVSPLRDSAGEIDRQLSGCTVTLVDGRRAIRHALDGIARLYGLTAAEQEVAALMLDGSPNKEIAERRATSPLTISTQIKSILGKVSVRNKTEFVWRLYQYAPPVQ